MFETRIEWLLGVVGLVRRPGVILPHERIVLRDLARRVAEIAALPVMAHRREMWVRHNRLERVRPMLLVFPEGSWRELLPASQLVCETQEARRYEWALRRRIYYHEHIRDDTVTESNWVIAKRITDTGWGLTPRRKPSAQETGAWAFDPVIVEPGDLPKLRFPEVRYDEEGTRRDLEVAQDLLGGILDVQLKGAFRLIIIVTEVGILASQSMLLRRQRDSPSDQGISSRSASSVQGCNSQGQGGHSRRILQDDRLSSRVRQACA